MSLSAFLSISIRTSISSSHCHWPHCYRFLFFFYLFFPFLLSSCLLWCSRLGFGQNIPLRVSLQLGTVAWPPVTSDQNLEWNILNLQWHLSREIQKRRHITASDQLNGETVYSQEAKMSTQKVFPDLYLGKSTKSAAAEFSHECFVISVVWQTEEYLVCVRYVFIHHLHLRPFCTVKYKPKLSYVLLCNHSTVTSGNDALFALLAGKSVWSFHFPPCRWWTSEYVIVHIFTW